jgi:hypothetical protein
VKWVLYFFWASEKIFIKLPSGEPWTVSGVVFVISLYVAVASFSPSSSVNFAVNLYQIDQVHV